MEYYNQNNSASESRKKELEKVKKLAKDNGELDVAKEVEKRLTDKEVAK